MKPYFNPELLHTKWGKAKMSTENSLIPWACDVLSKTKNAVRTPTWHGMEKEFSQDFWDFRTTADFRAQNDFGAILTKKAWRYGYLH